MSRYDLHSRIGPFPLNNSMQTPPFHAKGSSNLSAALTTIGWKALAMAYGTGLDTLAFQMHEGFIEDKKAAQEGACALVRFLVPGGGSR